MELLPKNPDGQYSLLEHSDRKWKQITDMVDDFWSASGNENHTREHKFCIYFEIAHSISKLAAQHVSQFGPEKLCAEFSRYLIVMRSLPLPEEVYAVFPLFLHELCGNYPKNFISEMLLLLANTAKSSVRGEGAPRYTSNQLVIGERLGLKNPFLSSLSDEADAEVLIKFNSLRFSYFANLLVRSAQLGGYGVHVPGSASNAAANWSPFMKALSANIDHIGGWLNIFKSEFLKSIISIGLNINDLNLLLARWNTPAGKYVRCILSLNDALQPFSGALNGTEWKKAIFGISLVGALTECYGLRRQYEEVLLGGSIRIPSWMCDSNPKSVQASIDSRWVVLVDTMLRPYVVGWCLINMKNESLSRLVEESQVVRARIVEGYEALGMLPDALREEMKFEIYEKAKLIQALEAAAPPQVKRTTGMRLSCAPDPGRENRSGNK